MWYLDNQKRHTEAPIGLEEGSQEAGSQGRTQADEADKSCKDWNTRTIRDALLNLLSKDTRQPMGHMVNLKKLAPKCDVDLLLWIIAFKMHLKDKVNIQSFCVWTILKIVLVILEILSS